MSIGLSYTLATLLQLCMAMAAPAANPAAQFPGIEYRNKVHIDSISMTPNVATMQSEVDMRDSGYYGKRSATPNNVQPPREESNKQHEKRWPPVLKWRWEVLMDGIADGDNAFLKKK